MSWVWLIVDSGHTSDLLYCVWETLHILSANFLLIFESFGECLEAKIRGYKSSWSDLSVLMYSPYRCLHREDLALDSHRLTFYKLELFQRKNIDNTRCLAFKLSVLFIAMRWCIFAYLTSAFKYMASNIIPKFQFCFICMVWEEEILNKFLPYISLWEKNIQHTKKRENYVYLSFQEMVHVQYFIIWQNFYISN